MKKIIVVAIIVLLGILGFILCPTRKENKVLVAYFSATGNTAGVAKNLASAINADLFEIVPSQKYTEEDLNWRMFNSRSSVEMGNRASRPEIASHVDNIEQYDVVFVGFPIWWGREPSIIDTFIESYDFSGKIIVPFATSGSTPTTEQAAESIRGLVSAGVAIGMRFPVDVSDKELKKWASEWL